MMERIKENIIVAIISTVIVAVAVGIWGLVGRGDLVRLLGGATATDLNELGDRISHIERQQGQFAVATDLTALVGEVRTIDERQGKLAAATDLDMLTERVHAVEERQGQFAAATELTALIERVHAVEKQQNQVALEYDARTKNLLPIGTIVAFFGRDDEIPAGWALCDGRNNPEDSLIQVDADAQQGGIQLPVCGQVHSWNRDRTLRKFSVDRWTRPNRISSFTSMEQVRKQEMVLIY